MVITKINDECLLVNNNNYKAMRRIITTIILSLFLMSGTGVAFADKHHKHHDKDRYEYRYDRKHSSKHHKHHYDDDDDYYKHLKKARKADIGKNVVKSSINTIKTMIASYARWLPMQLAEVAM